MLEHFPRNSTVPVPIDVPLFDGINQLTGQAGNLSLRVICLENGYTLDNADGVFRTSAASPTQSVSAWADYAYDYSLVIQPDLSKWARGHYRATIRHSTSGREFDFDFTLGLFVPRALGYSAVYDGSNLNLSVWVEELGIVQTDYTQLSNCKILSSTGTVISGGNLGTKTASADGTFNFVAAVNLLPVTNYIFTADAVAPAPAGRSNYSFTLRVGLARP